MIIYCTDYIKLNRGDGDEDLVEINVPLVFSLIVTKWGGNWSREEIEKVACGNLEVPKLLPLSECYLH